jgi:hypothetical protein
LIGNGNWYAARATEQQRYGGDQYVIFETHCPPRRWSTLMGKSHTGACSSKFRRRRNSSRRSCPSPQEPCATAPNSQILFEYHEAWRKHV